MDWTKIKMSELMRQKTRRMDAPYWIKLHSHNVLDKIRKKREAASPKLQAPSLKMNKVITYKWARPK